MKMNTQGKIRGFTLVELIIVIAVIGILATITVVGMGRFQADTRDAKRASSVTVIAEALEKYYLENGEYPSCSAITSSPTIILKGTDAAVYSAPGTSTGTNSLICNALNSSDTAAYAYVGDGSATCNSGSSCLSFTLQYVDETTSEVKTITSRHKTDIATSGVVTNLAAAPFSFSQINLTWGAISGAATYTVQRATDSGFTANLAESTASTNSAAVTGLSISTLYYLRVRPVDASGSANAWSNVASATTYSLATPTVTAAVNSPTQLTFSWNAAANATSYTIESADNSGFTSSTTTTGYGTLSRVYSGLAPNTTIFFRVKAAAAGYTSGWSSTVSATSIINAPTNVAMSATSSTSVSVSWTGSNGATSYRVEYSPASNFSPLYSTTVTGTTASLSGLLQGYPEYARVYALISPATSVVSSTVSTTTPMDQPATPIMAVDTHNWSSGQAHWLSYYTYCPAGSWVNVGPGFGGGYQSSGFNWNDGVDYYHGWGYNDYWNRGSPYGPGSPVRYRTNYSCSTPHTSSPWSPTSEEYIYVY